MWQPTAPQAESSCSKYVLRLLGTYFEQLDCEVNLITFRSI